MRFVLLEPAPVVAAVAVLTPLGEDVAAITGESPLRFRRMDRYESLGFAAVDLALRKANAAPSKRGDAEWGLLLGSSCGCFASNAEFFFDLERRPAPELSPALFSRTVSNAVNGEISIAHQIGGVNQTFVSGWAAGGEALAEAAALLADGKARWVVAGGIEAPDDVLRRMHAAARREPGMDWLPQEIAEGAAACVLTTEESAAGHLRLRAFGRGRDPRGTWSLASALDALGALDLQRILVANTVPPRLLDRWRGEGTGADFTVLPDRTGEIGAAGAPVAVALASPVHQGALIIARAREGGTVALALGP